MGSSCHYPIHTTASNVFNAQDPDIAYLVGKNFSKSWLASGHLNTEKGNRPEENLHDAGSNAPY